MAEPRNHFFDPIKDRDLAEWSKARRIFAGLPDFADAVLPIRAKPHHLQEDPLSEQTIRVLRRMPLGVHRSGKFYANTHRAPGTLTRYGKLRVQGLGRVPEPAIPSVISLGAGTRLYPVALLGRMLGRASGDVLTFLRRLDVEPITVDGAPEPYVNLVTLEVGLALAGFHGDLKAALLREPRILARIVDRAITAYRRLDQENALERLRAGLRLSPEGTAWLARLPKKRGRKPGQRDRAPRKRKRRTPLLSEVLESLVVGGPGPLPLDSGAPAPYNSAPQDPADGAAHATE